MLLVDNILSSQPVPLIVWNLSSIWGNSITKGFNKPSISSAVTAVSVSHQISTVLVELSVPLKL